MTEPAIITVAITGARARKTITLTVPVPSAEQIESTHEAFGAGAALVYILVPDKDVNPSSDPDLFAAVQESVRRHCPGMIIQFSTVSCGRTQAERGLALARARYGFARKEVGQFSEADLQKSSGVDQRVSALHAPARCETGD